MIRTSLIQSYRRMCKLAAEPGPAMYPLPSNKDERNPKRKRKRRRRKRTQKNKVKEEWGEERRELYR